MRIKKWLGMASNASPYAITPGVALEQINLQNTIPGQLTPRKGMELVSNTLVSGNSSGLSGLCLSLYRKANGDRADDNLLAHIFETGTTCVIKNLATNTTILSGHFVNERPVSFCEDRHGNVYAFQGWGYSPKRWGGPGTTMVDIGMPAPVTAPGVSRRNQDGGFYVERVDVVDGGANYWAPPAITVVGTLGANGRAAQLKAVVEAGVVTAIEVVDPGYNYTGPVRLTFSATTAASSNFSATASLAVITTTGITNTSVATVTGSLTAGHTVASSGINNSVRHSVGLTATDLDTWAVFSGGVWTATVPIYRSTDNTDSGAKVALKLNNAVFTRSVTTAWGLNNVTSFTTATNNGGVNYSHERDLNQTFGGVEYPVITYTVNGVTQYAAMRYTPTPAVGYPNYYADIVVPNGQTNNAGAGVFRLYFNLGTNSTIFYPHPDNGGVLVKISAGYFGAERISAGTGYTAANITVTVNHFLTTISGGSVSYTASGTLTLTMDTTGVASTTEQINLPTTYNSFTVVSAGTGWSAGQTGYVRLRSRSQAFNDTASTNYTNAQTVTFTVATSTQVGSAVADNIVINNGGSDFAVPPEILFTGGGGYGLELQAQLVSPTYFAAPPVISSISGTTVTLDRQALVSGTGVALTNSAGTASTTATVTIGLTTITVASATNLAVGQTLNFAPTNGGIGAIQVLNGGSNFTSPPTLTIKSGEASAVAVMRPTMVGSYDCAYRWVDDSVPESKGGPIYSSFSPISTINTGPSTTYRSTSELVWSIPSFSNKPARATKVELWRTSADQSLVFYQVASFAPTSTSVSLGTDTLSDESLFDPDRANYSAIPVVLPNGALNAYRFGQPRNDMAVCVAFQDRLWYGVSTSGEKLNSLFFSEYDEFESCPDINEIAIQQNVKDPDYLTALIPFGAALLAMQTAHCYSLSYLSQPTLDATVQLIGYRGCFNQQTWDIFEGTLYVMDERGIYSMSSSGAMESLSEPIADIFRNKLLRKSNQSDNYVQLKIDPYTKILRLFCSFIEDGQTIYPCRALCYHLDSKAWWMERWPCQVTATGSLKDTSGKVQVVAATTNFRVFHLDRGHQDTAAGTISAVTITNGGSGYSTPPVVTTATGVGADLQAVIDGSGRVTSVIIKHGGSGVTNGSALVFTGGGGSGAAATVTTASNNRTIPWSIHTGNMEFPSDRESSKAGNYESRSIALTYKPTLDARTVALQLYYNNATYPRNNVAIRDRGTGFVQSPDSPQTSLNMQGARSSLGPATGVSKAPFSGRTLDDMGGTDRHVSVELLCQSAALAGTETEANQPIIYELDIQGVGD